MSHRNHLPRRDLYAYRYKEGGNDMRELEAALWEIDQLERQTEFEYHRPSPNHPRTSGRLSVWCPPYTSGGPSNALYHEIQVSRTNSDLYPFSGSGMTPLSARCDDDLTSFNGYQRGYAHHIYPSHDVPSAFPGYPSSQSSMTSWDYRSSHYAPPSPSRSPNSDYQDFHDSIGIPQASIHRNHGFEPSTVHSRTSYGPSHHSQYSLQQIPARGISTPWQLQMVTQRSGRNESPSPEYAVDPRCAPTTPPQMMSPKWSMIATEGGTARSESPSVTSSRELMYGQNLRDMGYIGTAASMSTESFGYSSSDDYYSSDSDSV